MEVLKIMRKISIIILITLVFSGSIFAQDDGEEDFVAPSAMVWLSLDPGGRPAGLGKAFVSLADDANASYWNPAGLSFQTEQKSVNFMHEFRGLENDENDMFYDYATFILPVDRIGVFAFSAMYHDMGKSDRTDEFGNVIGTIHSYGVAPWISYSRKLTDRIGVGVNFKVAYEHLADIEGGSATTYAFDFGGLFKVPFPYGKFNLGVSLMNIGPDPREGEPLPRRLQWGFSYQILDDFYEMNDLLIVGEMSKELIALDSSFKKELFSQSVYRLGIEYFYHNIIGMRFGYYNDYQGLVKGVTVGFGMKYKGFSFDYGMVPSGKEVFGYNPRISFGYNF
jgi:hypothetical protein